MQAYWLGRGTRYDLSSTLPLLRQTGRVTVYRSVPAAIAEATEIRPGDYVSTSRAYAVQHAYANLGGHLGHKHRMLKQTVGLDELEPADGPCEFWYRPRSR